MASAKVETFIEQLKRNWVQILLALIAGGFTAEYCKINPDSPYCIIPKNAI